MQTHPVSLTALRIATCALFLLVGAVQAAAVCGDGILDGGETCDDFNTTPGDGCSASCATESGYECVVPGDPCIDINECGMSTDNCDANAVCTNLPGSFECACNPGFFGDGVVCESCPPGSFQDGFGQPSCLLCPPGRFQDGAGQTECQVCPVGTAQPLVGQSSCALCSAGEFQDQTGQTTCKLCPPGSFQAGEGALQCNLCVAGTFQDSAGQAECIFCDPGTFQFLQGQTSCLLCEAGTFQANSGSVSCNDCGVGTYQDMAGQSSCNACPANSTSPTGSNSVSSCVCEPGFDGDGQSCSSYFVGYKIKAPKTDAGGDPFSPPNVFPKGWVVTLEDTVLSDLDPSAIDNPENFVVQKERSLLLPGRKDDITSPDLAGLHYLRYQAKPGRESVQPAVDGKFPRPPKHVARTWQLSNELGTIQVDSTKVTALLVPAAKDLASGPAAPGDATHFVCYQVKPTRGAYAEQTPGTCDGDAAVNPGGSCLDDAACGGSGGAFTLCRKPKFRKDLQGFFADQFDDCAFDGDGGVSFDTTPAAGMCLFDFKRVVELCNPIDKSAVEAPRETEAVISESLAVRSTSLLCYQPVLAGSIADPAAAGLIAATVGDKVAPKQSKHAKRRVKDGNPVYTAPGNLFPAPSVVDTIKQELVCLPTEVAFVAAVP